MGKNKQCPKCGNKLFVEKEPDGWYEWCINCSYRSALTALVDYEQMLVTVGQKRPSGKDIEEPLP